MSRPGSAPESAPLCVCRRNPAVQHNGTVLFSGGGAESRGFCERFPLEEQVFRAVTSGRRRRRRRFSGTDPFNAAMLTLCECLFCWTWMSYCYTAETSVRFWCRHVNKWDTNCVYSCTSHIHNSFFFKSKCKMSGRWNCAGKCLRMTKRWKDSSNPKIPDI